MKKVLGKGLSALVPDIYKNYKALASGQEEVSSEGHGTTATLELLSGFVEIETERIGMNPEQPRAYFGEQALEELTQSIKENGIIQPLIVTRMSDGRYELVCGERRYRAAVRAGLKTVPAVIK